jgi:hypothetical protein
MVEQVDSSLEHDIGMPVGDVENFKIQSEEFIDAIVEDIPGWISDSSVKRRWDEMFDDDIQPGQLRQLKSWLDHEGLLEADFMDLPVTRDY